MPTNLIIAVALLSVPLVIKAIIPLPPPPHAAPHRYHDQNDDTGPAKETVNVWETTTDQAKLLQQQAAINFDADAGTNATTISVDETTTYQTIDGFGYALTGCSAELINGLGSNQGALLSENLRRQFGPAQFELPAHHHRRL